MTKFIEAAKQSAKQLIAGRVPMDELCRNAAHNLHERREVAKELSRKRISKPRKQYLQQRQKWLAVEKSMLESKYARIRSHAVSEHVFII